jgi:hypothetical protein
MGELDMKTDEAEHVKREFATRYVSDAQFCGDELVHLWTCGISFWGLSTPGIAAK